MDGCSVAHSPHTPLVSCRSPALCFLFLRFPDVVITNVQARWTIVDYKSAPLGHRLLVTVLVLLLFGRKFSVNCIVVAHNNQDMLDQQKPS